MGKSEALADIGRVMALLNDLVAMSGRTKSSLERELALSSGYLSRILARTEDISLSHLLPLLDALDVSPGGFFSRCCPDGGGKRGLLNRVAAAEEDPDLDEQRILRTLVRLLQRAQNLAASEAEPAPLAPVAKKVRRKQGSDPARSG